MCGRAPGTPDQYRQLRYVYLLAGGTHPGADVDFVQRLGGLWYDLQHKSYAMTGVRSGLDS